MSAIWCVKTKSFSIFSAVYLFLVVGSPIFGQSLLTQAFLSGGGGVNVITNSLNLSIGYSTNGGRDLTELLFRNVWVQTPNVGQVYTLGPGDDPADFALFTQVLTDGAVSYLGYGAIVGPSGGSRSGITEANFFSYLPPGNNGIDLAGFNISCYSLVFTSLKFDSPGSNPGMSGIWTDYSYSATFSVFGEPAPEPASLSLFCVVLGVLLAIRRCHQAMSRSLRASPDRG